jgi:restriction endonuclease S subunit
MKTFKLGDVCLLSKGKTITRATSIEGEVPVIGGGLGPTYFHNIANRKPPVITISASGANAGFVNYWNLPIWASDCTTIVEKSESPASIDYIFKYLQSRQEFINTELRRGSAQPHVYPSDIADLEIPLPSLDRQREIVEKLDSSFAEIDLLEENLALSDEKANQLLQSLLSSALSFTADENDSINDSGNQSTVTKLAPLRDVFTLEYGKPLDKDFRKEDGAFLAYGANGPISPANKYLIEGPCVIVGRKGSAGEIIFVENNAWPLDVTYYIKHDPKESDLRYLYYILKSLNIKQFVRGVKPGLNRNDVYELDIPFPSLEKQQEIVEKLDRAFTQIELLKVRNKRQKDYAVTLRQSLLSSALSLVEAVV